MKKIVQAGVVLFFANIFLALPPETLQAQPLSDIVITEIMQNPASVRDSDGEWFEIFNTTKFDIDLSGWSIEDGGTDLHVISPGVSLMIPSESALILCRNDDQTANGDVPCAYRYSQFVLDNNDDEVILRDAGGAEIDRVDFDGGPIFPSPAGASMYFTATMGDDNNDGSLWATSTSREPDFENDDCESCSDFGSPGQVDESFLPVELVSFGATLEGNKAWLAWETASELNNAGFEVEHRSEGEGFASAGWVEGAGTTNEAQSYSFAVANLEPGTHSFRLKQVDFDGTVAYSSVVSVLVSVDGVVVDEPYPNPFNPVTTISFWVEQDQDVLVEVIDMLGRRVQQAFNGPAVANTRYDVRISGVGLSSGRYLIRTSGATFQRTHSVVLAK